MFLLPLLQFPYTSAVISEALRLYPPGANTLRETTGPLYEYACHEGNYGMVNILRGARADEQKKAEADKKKAEEAKK
jgi:cytochrome P450